MLETLILILFISLPTCGTVEYYVTPTQPPNLNYPLGKPCHTLDEYALHYSQQLSNQKGDVSLIFLNGVHTLSQNLTVSNTSNLYLTVLNYRSVNNFTYSYMDTEDAAGAKIHVDMGCHITIENISSFQIENIDIYGTAYSINRYTIWLIDYFESTTLVLDVRAVLLTQVSVKGCRLNIVANAIQGLYSQFSDTEIFIMYIPQDDIFHVSETKILLFWCYLGGTSQIIYTYNENLQIRETQRLTLNINNCNIFSNSNLGLLGKIIYSETIRFLVGFQTHTQIDITDTDVYGGISIRAEEHYNDICLRIHNSKIFGSESQGIIIFSEGKHTKIEVYITDSTIKQSLGVMGLGIRSTFANRVAVSVTNTIFTANSEALEVLIVNDDLDMDLNLNESSKVSDQPSTSQNVIPKSVSFVLLQNTTVDGNFVNVRDSAAVTVLNVNVMIKDCTFTNNRGSAVNAYFSSIILSAHNVFANNSGVKGGALSLYQSRMFLSEPFHILFTSNHVENVGGAIYVKQVLSNDPHFDSCFYKITGSNNNPTGHNQPGKVTFKNNFSKRGGDDVYGGFLHSKNCRRTRNEQENNETIFHNYNESSWSPVSSDPTRVCFCDDKGLPQCEVLDYIYVTLPPRYPGEHFTVPAVLVGYEFGTVPGIIYSYIMQNDTNATIGDMQSIQEARHHRICSLLNFTIETPTANTTEVILLSARQYRNDDLVNLIDIVNRYETKPLIGDILYHPVLLYVMMEDCPLGFSLSATPPHVCKCHTKLERNGVKRCIITNHTGLVYRSGTVWVSASFNDDENESFLVHQYCPYRYCKPQNISVDLRFPDVQCAQNHSGVLCGGCRDNLSLALGTSKCLPCNNTYTSLLMVFVFAGLLLVFFIKILDLTVAKGTINGLIFYANIVWANYSVFFPNAESAHPALQILHVFIAWLNLDLGIETCFINGLDAYWKTWLQYIFPIYIWSIVGAMIISSHYSTRASRIFGNNSVPVLATLILLSYAKLLRCIITSLGFSLIEYQRGTRVVWSHDGNVPYFGAAHSILFLAALAALLFLWLPYTIVLLTLQWLRRKAYIKPLRWINRWKPFFDANLGQLKPTHHYWFGLLLLVRVVLLVLFAITSSILPRLNILAITIAGVGLISLTVITGLFYKSLYLSLFESSFIINLTLLGITKLYMQSTQDASSTVVYVSISIVLIKFLCIVTYHAWSRIRTTYTIYKRRHINTDQSETTTERELEEVANVPDNRMHYREPLLDSI